MQIEINNNSNSVFFDDFTDNELIIHIGENAHLDFYCVIKQNLPTRQITISQSEGSALRLYALNMSSYSMNDNLLVRFEGENAQCELYGCFITREDQRIENHILVDHKSPKCKSKVLYKYVLSDEATGVFEGRVLVRKNAQHTISQEINRNLCTSAKSKMITKPELEIYADDVECSHGGTVGQLNEQALFYMRQRGISLEKAEIMLQESFIREVIDLIPNDEIRNYFICDDLQNDDDLFT